MEIVIHSRTRPLGEDTKWDGDPWEVVTQFAVRSRHFGGLQHVDVAITVKNGISQYMDYRVSLEILREWLPKVEIQMKTKAVEVRVVKHTSRRSRAGALSEYVRQVTEEIVMDAVKVETMK